MRYRKTLEIDSLITSRNGDGKIKQTIRILSGSPTSIRKMNQFWLMSTSNTYRKDLGRVNGSGEETSSGTLLLYTRFCSSSNRYKKKLRALAKHDKNVLCRAASKIYRDTAQ